MGMNKLTGIVLLIVGCGLLYFGWQAHESVGSSVTQAVTGAPTNKAIWLLAIGALAAASGLYAVLRRV
jgi:high-affinity Fe2+/Pb2+ permease